MGYKKGGGAMQKELKLFGEKPKPKKANNDGKELVTLKEFLEMRKAGNKAD
jgi:hypothetical protein